MNTRKFLLVLVLIAVLFLTACGDVDATATAVGIDKDTSEAIATGVDDAASAYCQFATFANSTGGTMDASGCE